VRKEFFSTTRFGCYIYWREGQSESFVFGFHCILVDEREKKKAKVQKKKKKEPRQKKRKEETKRRKKKSDVLASFCGLVVS